MLEKDREVEKDCNEKGLIYLLSLTVLLLGMSLPLYAADEPLSHDLRKEMVHINQS